MNTRLGAFLRQIRKKTGLTQNEVAGKLSRRLRRKISQGLVAQLETGRIITPDAGTLTSLAKVYGVDYEEFVFRIALDVIDKYRHESELSEFGKSRLELWEAGLKRFSTVGNVKGLEVDQQRAKAVFIEKAEILDLAGCLKWQTSFPHLRELWLVVPDFLDDTDPEIQKATIRHLKDGVRIHYFVLEGEEEQGGKFWRLQRMLPELDPAITPKMVEEQVIGFPLNKEQQRWLTTNLIIAHPPPPDEAVGFRILRQEGGQSFAIRMAAMELDKIVRPMTQWVVVQLEKQHKPFLSRVAPGAGDRPSSTKKKTK